MHSKFKKGANMTSTCYFLKISIGYPKTDFYADFKRVEMGSTFFVSQRQKIKEKMINPKNSKFAEFFIFTFLPGLIFYK